MLVRGAFVPHHTQCGILISQVNQKFKSLINIIKMNVMLAYAVGGLTRPGLMKSRFSLFALPLI